MLDEIQCDACGVSLSRNLKVAFCDLKRAAAVHVADCDTKPEALLGSPSYRWTVLRLQCVTLDV
jgi:hypothetical protein